MIDLYFDLVWFDIFSKFSRNIPSGNYIYSYGYKDEEGSPENKIYCQRPNQIYFYLVILLNIK